MKLSIPRSFGETGRWPACLTYELRRCGSAAATGTYRAGPVAGALRGNGAVRRAAAMAGGVPLSGGLAPSPGCAERAGPKGDGPTARDSNAGEGRDVRRLLVPASRFRLAYLFPARAAAPLPAALVLAALTLFAAPAALAQPAVQTATVQGTNLTMDFSGGALKTDAPLSTAFEVKVNGNVADISSDVDVLVAPPFVNQVVVRMQSRAAREDKVTLSYDSTEAGDHPLQDTDGNQVTSFTDRAFTNTTEQGPRYQSAAVNGATLTMNFDLRLDESAVPATNTFTVTVGTATRTVSTVSISGKSVTLTLASAVTGTDALKVGYERPLDGTTALRAHTPINNFKNVVATFTDKTVTNSTPPVFSSAAVDGTRLTVTFDESLATGSAPSGSAFSVSATATDGTVRTIAGTGTVTIAAAAVTVTLGSAVTATETATVGYTKPSSSPLRDAAGNEVATFSGETVANNTGPPTFSSAAVDGTRLTVTFDENLATGSTPAGSAFEVTATESGTSRTIAGTGTAAIVGATASVTLASVVKATETLKVGYTKPSANPLQDAGGDEVATFSAQTATNSSVVPTVSSASVSGSDLEIFFSEEVVVVQDDFPVAAFTVSAAGIDRAGELLASTHAMDPDIHLAGVAIAPGDTATLSYTKPASHPVTDLAGNELASFSGTTVTNNTPADAAPEFHRATVDGATLVMTFNASLKTTSTPATSAFTVTVGTTTRNVSSVDISGKTVTLTLASAVTDTDTVKVKYTKPATGTTLQGANNAEVATFGDQSVTNNTVDTDAPEFSNASVNGATLAVTFDEALDTGSTPSGSAFTVTATATDGTTRTLAGTGTVAIAAATPTVATVTLDSAVTAAEAVQVRYAKPAANPLEDANANAVASFGNQTVSNATAPAFQSAAVNGATLTVNFDVRLDTTTSTEPSPDAFFVTVGSARRTVATGGVAIDARTVTLTLDSAVTPDDVVKVRYTKPTNDPLKGTNGTDVETFADQTVSNATAPAFQSAMVDGADLTVTFDVDLDTGSVPGPSAFSVTVSGARRIVATGGVAIAAKTVTLTLASAVTPDDVVKVRYTQPSTDPLEGSANDAAVATFADQSVTNATAPVFQSAMVNAADLTVTFDVRLDQNSVPAPGDFSVTVGSAARTVNSVAIDDETVTLTLASAVTDTDTVKVRYDKPASNPLQANTNQVAVATFADQDVTNRTDTTAPTFQSAAVDGATLELTFDEALDATIALPATSAFTVTVGSAGRTVNTVSLDVATPAVVTLTLASAVTLTDSVKVRYAQPTSNPLRDGAGNAVATFADQTVTNATTPTFQSAAVNGATLEVTFNQALDADSVPAPGDFTVTVDTTARTVSTVAIAETTVTLTLASAVIEHEAVTVAYTKPGSGDTLQDTDGHAVATFAARTVQNHTDSTVPAIQGERVAVNGARLTLGFDEALDESSVPAPGDFTVTVDTTPRTVSTVAIAEATVTLTLASAVRDTDTVQVTYTAPTSNPNPIQDLAGNVVGDFGPMDVTNHTADVVAPGFVRASVNGAALTMTFDEALDAGSVPAARAFTVTAGNTARAVSNVALPGGETVALTLASAVAAAEAVRVRYTRPSSKPLADGAGNAVASFANHRVANHTVDATAPGFERASVNGAVLTVVFDEALDPGSVPVPGAFTVTVGGVSRKLVPDRYATGGLRGVALVGATAGLRLESPVTDTAVVAVRYTRPANNPLRDGAGNAVATFAGQAVRNDTSALPVFVNATVNADELVIFISKGVVAPPESRDLRVYVNGTVRGYGQYGNGSSTLELDDLSPPVTSRDTVTASYTPGKRPVLDEDGNALAGFSNKPVENLTPDETPPKLAGAVVRGTTLTLTFDEPLDANVLPPAAGAFTVAGTETATQVVAAAFHPTDDTRVALTLSQAVTPAPGVTVGYTKPGANPLRDPAGNEVATFANEPLRAPPAPPPPPLPPPTPSTVPSFTSGATAEFSLPRDHADSAPVGTVTATDADGDTLTYSLASGGDSALFTIDATGLIAVAPATALADEAKDVFTLTAQVSDGEDALGNVESTPAIDDTLAVTITLVDEQVHHVALMPAASHAFAQGFVRVVNHSGEAGEVFITAIDDAGHRYEVELDIEARHTAPFNSDDLEQGNARKGLEDGVGEGEGDWRLELASPLDLEVLSYIRTEDGFVTSMHALAPEGAAGQHRVVFLNPASNRHQVSWLRLVNPGEAPVDITIAGTDDAGEAGASPVTLTLPAGESRRVSAQALESGGAGLDGALGDGTGKWRLDVSAPQPIRIMSLLENPTGHLTNLSATPRKQAPGAAPGPHRVPLVPSASDPHHRQGFVRVVNHSAQGGTVSITAIDDAGMKYGPVMLDIEAHHTAHFNSDDLERGNARKGLEDGTGPGEGSWRLELESSLDLEVLSYIRTEDGFVTIMHALAPEGEAGHRVVFFNPASNRHQVSWLRLVNPGETAVAISIAGTDGAGEAGESPVTLTLPAGASRALSAQALESGEGEGLGGALGDGTGKWRLQVSAPQPIRVMSLLKSPTGHLTNLSAAPGRP